VLPPHWII